jgi:hypothetical protein
MDALLAFRSGRALPSWEATVQALLDAADVPDSPPPARAALSRVAASRVTERTAP